MFERLSVDRWQSDDWQLRKSTSACLFVQLQKVEELCRRKLVKSNDFQCLTRVYIEESEDEEEKRPSREQISSMQSYVVRSY